MRIPRALLKKLVAELDFRAPAAAAMLEMILLTDKSASPLISFPQPVSTENLQTMRYWLKLLLTETPAQRRERLKQLEEAKKR